MEYDATQAAIPMPMATPQRALPMTSRGHQNERFEPYHPEQGEIFDAMKKIGGEK
jgi:hypothetical protein